MMKKIIFIASLFLIVSNIHSQDLSEIKFSNASTLSFFSFITDQKIVIRISVDGKITEWGNLWDKGYYNYQPGKLVQYMGRVEYYGTEADGETLKASLSREDMANLVGTATESLIRNLSDLKSEKVVELKDKKIRVLDLKKLEKIANVFD